MSILTLIAAIQPQDADLLTRSDEWLDTERENLATEITNLAGELKAVLSAQRLKRRLQQENLVPVQQLEVNRNGDITDVTVKVMPLPDAIKAISKPRNLTDQANRTAQMMVWGSDGYDIPASSALR